MNLFSNVASRQAILATMSLLCLSGGLFTLSARAEETASSGLRYYSYDQAYSVYTPGAKIHSSTDKKAPVLYTPVVGEKLLVLEKPSPDELPTMSEGLLTEPWVMVSPAKSPSVKGFIWGGDLAKTAIEVDLDADDVKELVLTRYKGSETPNYEESPTEQMPAPAMGHYALKILRDGKTIAEKDFKVPYPEVNSLETTVYTPAGFSPMTSFIVQDHSPQACGIPGGKHLFSWSNGQLREEFDESYISEAAVFSDGFDYVFPLDRGGKTNVIRVLRENQSNWSDDCECYKTVEKTEFEYKWTGSGFTKTAVK